MRQFLMLLLPILMLLSGCASSSNSNTARTGTEQLLVSNAVDQTLGKVDFSPFADRDVFLQEKYLECVDKNYVVASIRHRLLRSGARLVDEKDAEIVIEPRSGAVGTNTSSSFVGVPEITLPGMMTLPEVRFIERRNQKGVAKIGFVAYEAKTKNTLGTGGVSVAESDDNNWFVLGMGPYQNGSMRDELSNGRKVKPPRNSPTIPSSVAFAPPPNRPREIPADSPLHQPGRVQLAGGEEPEEKAAAREIPQNAPPEWAR